MRDQRGPGRHRPLVSSPSPLCWICGGSAVDGWRVVINEQNGFEWLGWICVDCHQAMTDMCPICQGEEEG